MREDLLRGAPPLPLLSSRTEQPVFLGETVNEFLFVLVHPALKEIGYSGVKDAGSVGHDVDVVDGHGADCGMEAIRTLYH